MTDEIIPSLKQTKTCLIFQEENKTAGFLNSYHFAFFQKKSAKSISFSSKISEFSENKNKINYEILMRLLQNIEYEIR
jgi:hemolysin-activating ACP:hemolysin acyltransferase